MDQPLETTNKKFSDSKSFRRFEERSASHPLARAEGNTRGRSAYSKRSTSPRPVSDDEEEFAERQAPASRSSVRSIVVRGSDEYRSVDISNLSDDLSDHDLKEIFSEVQSQLKRYKVHSDGSALLVFDTRAHAKSCVEEFDKAKVDGKPMYLRLVQAQEAAGLADSGSSEGPKTRFMVEKKTSVRSDLRAQPRRDERERYRSPRDSSSRHESKGTLFGGGLSEWDEQGGDRGSTRARPAGRGRGPRSRGGARGKFEKAVVSTDDLNAELVAYQKNREKTSQ